MEQTGDPTSPHSTVTYEDRLVGVPVGFERLLTGEDRHVVVRLPRTDVPARIASLGGDTKLAYILREPIDRIESHLAHRLHNRGEIKRLKHFIRASCYALQLDKFIAHIERADILLLDFEQLRQDPRAILEQISDFLDIDRIAIQSKIHNTRGIEYQLDAKLRVELSEAVRPDVQRLISVYGFKSAETWLQGAT